MPYAYATMKVKVRCKSNWSGQTTIDQVSKQAATDAHNQIMDAIKGHDISLVGDIEITAVHTDITPLET